jgi:TRAP-type C4-dicarboxylate transport system permease small subunit
METFITILILSLIMIMCYYINRYIIKSINKTNYSWNEVKTNLLMSIFMPVSFAYWIIYILSILPSLPEKPPRWM